MSQAQRIAADPAISAFVTANAGSGKTKTLIDRTARLLLAGAEPATILCVTYTKAAAAEMQRRLFDLMGGWSVTDDAGLRQVLADLEGREAESFSPRELSRARTLFARALETPGGLKIQTIHAFCERVLRRFPLEAGVSPGFEVIDDGAAAAIAAEARAGVAELAMSGEFALVSEAYAAFSIALDFQSFQSMFAAFEAERDAIAAYVDHVGGLGGLPAAVFAACGLDDLEDAGEIEEMAVLPPRLDPMAWFAAAKALARGSDTDVRCGLVYQRVAEAALAGEPLVDAVRGLFFTGTGDLRKRLATKAIDADICAWLAEEQQRVALAMERARAARVATDTVRALTLAHVYAQLYDAAKAARGVLDFADLVGKTAALLRDGPAAAWVLFKLDGGVDHILLDEAQDTAPDQWAILKRLTGEFFAGEGRPSDRTAERTLFIVGDEKQSIYSFQGADPERLIAETQGYRPHHWLRPPRRAAGAGRILALGRGGAAVRRHRLRARGHARRRHAGWRGRAAPHAHAHRRSRLRRPLGAGTRDQGRGARRLERSARRRDGDQRQPAPGGPYRGRDRRPGGAGRRGVRQGAPRLAAGGLWRCPDPGAPPWRAFRGHPAGAQAAGPARGRRRPTGALGAYRLRRPAGAGALRPLPEGRAHARGPVEEPALRPRRREPLRPGDRSGEDLALDRARRAPRRAARMARGLRSPQLRHGGGPRAATC
jgi:hypothetical protein